MPAGAAAATAADEVDLAMEDLDPVSGPVARTRHLVSPKFAGVIPIAPGTPSHALHGLSVKILHCLVPDPELVGAGRYTASATFVTNTSEALTLDELADLEEDDYVGGVHFVTWIATLTVEAAVGAEDGGYDDVDDDVDMGDDDGGGGGGAPGSPKRPSGSPGSPKKRNRKTRRTAASKKGAGAEFKRI